MRESSIKEQRQVLQTKYLGFRGDKAICFSTERITHLLSSLNQIKEKQGKQNIMVGCIEGGNLFFQPPDHFTSIIPCTLCFEKLVLAVLTVKLVNNEITKHLLVEKRASDLQISLDKS